MRNILSESEVKKNHLLLIKLFPGGWILARDIFTIQSVFTEERTFFKALCFIKRIEVSQFEQPQAATGGGLEKVDGATSSPGTASAPTSLNPKANDVLIKLNERMGTPSLNITLSQHEQSPDGQDLPEEKIGEMIKNSIFNEFITSIEVIDPSKATASGGSSTTGDQSRALLQFSQLKMMRVVTEHSSVVSGLKCMLQLRGAKYFVNMNEDFFNVDAQPFVP